GRAIGFSEAPGASFDAIIPAPGEVGPDVVGLGALQLRYGITDRWQWDVGTALFTYGGGEPGGIEWLPTFGAMVRNLLDRDDHFALTLIWGGGVDIRYWFDARTTVVFGMSAWATTGMRACSPTAPCGGFDQNEPDSRFSMLHHLRVMTRLGITHT